MPTLEPTATLESEILTLEKQCWDAFKSRDIPAMEPLIATPCLRVGPEGATVVEAEQFREMMQTLSEEWRLLSFEIDERNASIRPIGNDVVILAYRVDEQLEHGGRAQSLDAYYTTVWVREDGAWKCAAYTETIATSAS